MELTRELIIKEARRWVGYGESDWADYLAYDDPKGGNGRSNYNRFSWLFDRLLAPKTYAGGNKDGFAWWREWQPTPVFLPRKSPGQRSLAGCHSWVAKE